MYDIDTPRPKAYIFSADTRFAHAMAHEIERLGWSATIRPVLRSAEDELWAQADLVLADGDDAPDEVWITLRRESTAPWVMWARRAVDLPGVVVLRRPFDLEALAHAVKVAEGALPRVASLPARPKVQPWLGRMRG